MLCTRSSFNKEYSGSVVECSYRDLEALVRGSQEALCCALEQFFILTALYWYDTETRLSMTENVDWDERHH